MRLDGPDGSHIAWATADPVSPNGWESSHLTLLKALLPHIRQFVRVRQTLVKAEALGASVTALLDTPRVGVIHLDRDGRVVEANDRARAILRQRRWAGRTGVGCCPPACRRTRPAWSGWSPTRCRPPVRPPSVGRCGSSGRPRGPRSWCTSNRWVIRHLDLGARYVVAAQVLLVPSRGTCARIDPALVAAALGLTPVESEIAAWLAEGRTVREIAGATWAYDRLRLLVPESDLPQAGHLPGRRT